MLNALTIDVEDGRSGFARGWLRLEIEPSDSVAKNTERLLETLAEYNVKATCFILGDVAKTFPALIRKIAESGHEIAAHGLSHKQIFKLTEQEFRSEVSDCKKLLEDITSCLVEGYRAPAFSVMSQTKWALEVLAEEGFEYDSSVYPISGKRYGWPGFSRDICKIDLPSGRSIIEVPMSTITILGKTLPVAGGGYIRHFPYAVTKWAIKRIQKIRPAIVYMHPYEIDTEAWEFPTEHLSNREQRSVVRFRRMQLRNRHTVYKKLCNLLFNFEFTTIAQVIEDTYNLPVWLIK